LLIVLRFLAVRYISHSFDTELKHERIFYFYRLNFSTAFSSNAVSICRAVNLNKVTRIEVATRYRIKYKGILNKEVENAVSSFFVLSELEKNNLFGFILKIFLLDCGYIGGQDDRM